MGTKFTPNYAIHPGVFLSEELISLNLSQKDLADKTGISRTIINEVIKGKRAINAKMAVLFEKALESPAKFWLNLQIIYDEAKAREGLEKKQISFEIEIPNIEAADLSFSSVIYTKKERYSEMVA